MAERKEGAAVSKRKGQAERLWRDAWEGAPYRGVVTNPDGLQERLIIQNDKVSAEYGLDAEILDDGRSVHVVLGDRVAFGVVTRAGNQAPIAVNIFRLPKLKKKKEQQGVEPEFDFSAWAPKSGGALNPSGSIALPPTLKADLVGIVRNQSFNTGNWFVECEEVYEEFQIDVMIHQHEMIRGAGVGDAIVFRVKPPRPEAKCIHVIPGVRKATGELAEAALARGFRDGMRCFRCGGLHLIRDCPEKGKGKGKGKGKSNKQVMRMVGIVKWKDPRGRFLIFCQDISDVYAKDAQIPVEEIPEGVKIGDRVAFDVHEPPEGHQGPPLARNVRILTSGSGQGAAGAQGDGEDDAGEDAEDVLEEDVEEMEPEAEAGEADEDAEVDGGAETVEDEVDAGAAEAQQEVPPKAKRLKIERPGKAGQAAEEAQEPDTLDGWKAAQDRLFRHMHPLPKDWIRIRSKSKGLLYFYNVVSGKSTEVEPRQ